MDALGAVALRPVSRERLGTLAVQEPALTGRLWRLAMIDAAINHCWIFRIGRLVGRARIANFLCEMLLRLHARGLCDLDGFDVPLARIVKLRELLQIGHCCWDCLYLDPETDRGIRDRIAADGPRHLATA